MLPVEERTACKGSGKNKLMIWKAQEISTNM